MAGTHWKKLTNRPYMGAWDMDGNDLTVTIQAVKREEVTMEGGATSMCIVASLEGCKPLIINSTNGQTIENLYGPKIEDWAGKSVTLYASKTSLKGKQVDCVRIRAQKPGPKPKMALSDERFSKALESIKAGTFTADKLREQYELSAGQQAQLEGAEGA